MKVNKKTLIIASIAFVVLVAGAFIWYNVANSKLKFSIDQSKVSTIEIFNGSNGKKYKITEQSNIQHIVKNLNSITFIKGESTRNYNGFTFSTVIMDKGGNELWKGSINSINNIIYKDYFYNDNNSSIDFNYIKNLLATLMPIAE